MGRLIEVGERVFDEGRLPRSHGYEALDPVGHPAGGGDRDTVGRN